MSSVRLPVALAVLAGIGTFSAAASAQVEVSGGVQVQTPQAAPPPPPPAQPAPVIVGQPAPAQPVYAQPGYAQPGYAQPVYAQPGYAQPGYPPPMMEDHGRFRFGFDVGAGYLIAGGSDPASMMSASASGPAINFGLRLGWQINNPFAVYAQFNLPIGFAGGSSSDGSTAVAGAAIAETNAVMFEYTWNNLLHFGIGPSLDGLLGGICGASSSGSSFCVGAAGWTVGADGRFAVTIGSNRPGRRTGFSIGLDLHPIFAPSSVYFFATANIGYEYD